MGAARFLGRPRQFSFAILLAFSEIALLAVGLTFVMANGDIDLSVGSVLALSGAVAAVIMKDTELGPLAAVGGGLAAGVFAGVINGWLTAYVGLPAFIATLGTFYWARGIGSSIVAGTQLNGFPESFNLIGRSLYELLDVMGMAPTGGLWLAVAKAVSVQTIFVHRWSRSSPASCSPTRPSARRSTRSAATSAPRISPASTRGACGSRRWSISSTLRGLRRDDLRRLLSQLHSDRRPVARTRRISSIIIGGGSIFGGYGTMIGSLAGAGVITLIRSLLSLQIILKDGSSFVLPQQWQNVFIGVILIVAVVGDIWLRQNNILGQWFGRGERARRPAPVERPTERQRHDDVRSLRCAAINKSFGPVQALVNVNLRSDAGRGARPRRRQFGGQVDA